MSESIHIKIDNDPTKIIDQLNQLIVAQLNLLNEEIFVVDNEIIQLDRLKNKMQPPKAQLKKTYLQNKNEMKEETVIQESILSIELNIDAVLQNAELELENPQPKKLQTHLQVQSMYDDYSAPKLVKATLEPYKKQINKLVSKGKAPAPPQKSKVNYPPVAQRQSSMQKNPQKIGNQPLKRSNSFVKNSNAPQIPKSHEVPQIQVPIQIQPKINPVPQNTLVKTAQVQINKKESPITSTQLLKQPIVSQENKSEIHKQATFLQNNHQDILDMSGQKHIQITAKLKLEQDQLYIEYNRNIKYYHERESNAKNKFLNKLFSHTSEKQKVENDLYIKSKKEKQTKLKEVMVEEDEKKFNFFQMNPSISFNQTSSIMINLESIQKKSLSLLQYSDVIGSYLQQFVEVQFIYQFIQKFDKKLLHVLQKTNTGNIINLQVRDLSEVFRIWSLIQMLNTNFNNLLQLNETNNQNQNKILKTHILEYISTNFLSALKSTQKTTTSVQQIATQQLQTLSFDIKQNTFINSIHNTNALQKTIALCKILNLNKVILQIFQVGIYPKISDGILSIINNQTSTKELQKFLSILSILLSHLFFDGRTKVSFFRQQDIKEFL